MLDTVGVRVETVDCPIIDSDPLVIFPTVVISPAGAMMHLSVNLVVLGLLESPCESLREHGIVPLS